MKRVFVYLSALVGLGGAVFLAGNIRAQAPAAAAAPAAGAAPAARPTVAVFNMAAVMRGYENAKYHVYKLNEERKTLSGNLTAWRGEFVKKQQEAQVTPDQKRKEALALELLALQRQIEDEDRKINKALNDKASEVIGKIHDQIKSVVDKTAEMNGYHVIFSYPDAVTPEEANSPYLKELRLKPPAAHPFYVAKYVDLTPVVVQSLNQWYPAEGKIPAGADVPQPTSNGPSPVAPAGATGVPGK